MNTQLSGILGKLVKLETLLQVTCEEEVGIDLGCAYGELSGVHLGSRAQVAGVGRDCSSGGKEMQVTKEKLCLVLGAA